MGNPSDSESSDSSNEFMVSPDKLKLESTLFEKPPAKKKPNPPPPPVESSDDSDYELEDPSQNSNAELMAQVMKNLESTQKLESLASTASMSTSQSQSSTKELSTEIADLLLQGESNITASASAHDEPESENEAEGASAPPGYTIPKEGVRVTLAGEAAMVFRKKRKKGENIEEMLKKKLNQQLRSTQLSVHKVGLLCWLAHGFYVNQQMNNPILLAACLELTPKNCHPKGRVDLAYLEKITKWFKNVFTTVTGKVEDSVTTLNLLKRVKKKEIYDYKELVALYVSTLRALGLTCRLVISLQPPPMKVSRDQLIGSNSASEKKEVKVEVKKEPGITVKQEKQENLRPMVKIEKLEIVPDKTKAGTTSKKPVKQIVKEEPVKKEDQGPTISARLRQGADARKRAAEILKRKREDDSPSEKPVVKKALRSRPLDNEISQSTEDQTDESRTRSSGNKFAKPTRLAAKLSKSLTETAKKAPEKKKGDGDEEDESENKDNKDEANDEIKIQRASRSRTNATPVQRSTDKNNKSRTSKAGSQVSKPAKSLAAKIAENASQNDKDKEAVDKNDQDHSTDKVQNTRISRSRAKTSTLQDKTKKTNTSTNSASATLVDKAPTRLAAKLAKKTPQKDKDEPDDDGEEKNDEDQSHYKFGIQRASRSRAKVSTLPDIQEKSTASETPVKTPGRLAAKLAEKAPRTENEDTDDDLEEDEDADVSIDAFIEKKILKSNQQQTTTKKEGNKKNTKKNAGNSSRASGRPMRLAAKIAKNRLPKDESEEEERDDSDVDWKNGDDEDDEEEDEPEPTDNDEEDDDDEDFVTPKFSQSWRRSTNSKAKTPVSRSKSSGSRTKLAAPRVKTIRRPKSPSDVRKLLSDDEDSEEEVAENEEEVARSGKEEIRERKVSQAPRVTDGKDYWAEVYVESEESWICVNVPDGKIHCTADIYKHATDPVLYVMAWNSAGKIKDVTRRYCPYWLTFTRKQRVDEKWWLAAHTPWQEPESALTRAEDEMLKQKELEQPLPKTVSECKGHPLYVLPRHLLKFEALYPNDVVPLGYVRGEPIYSRHCVHTLMSRETWTKKARVVKPGEVGYKIVKSRPKWDKLSGARLKDEDLEIFGKWQTDPYVPPEAKNGVIPRNEYGNVDLFKQCMLPKGTVHIRLPGLNRIARKLDIDCCPAVVGFNFGGKGALPAFDGFIVCEEFEDVIREAWEVEQKAAEIRANEKYEKRVYGNWRKLIKAALIRERLKFKYDFEADEEKPSASNKRTQQSKRGVKKAKTSTQ